MFFYTTDKHETCTYIYLYNVYTPVQEHKYGQCTTNKTPRIIHYWYSFCIFSFHFAKMCLEFASQFNIHVSNVLMQQCVDAVMC